MTNKQIVKSKYPSSYLDTKFRNGIWYKYIRSNELGQNGERISLYCKTATEAWADAAKDYKI